MNKEPMVAINARIAASEKAALERIAANENRSMSWIIRQALREYLQKVEEEY